MPGPSCYQTNFKSPIPSKYFLHNIELESVSAAMYLGLTISEDLRWGKHIDFITKKANQTLGFLRRNIKVHNQDLKATAYKTLSSYKVWKYRKKERKNVEHFMPRCESLTKVRQSFLNKIYRLLQK